MKGMEIYRELSGFARLLSNPLYEHKIRYMLVFKHMHNDLEIVNEFWIKFKFE